MAPAEEPGVIHKLGVQAAVAVWLAALNPSELSLMVARLAALSPSGP